MPSEKAQSSQASSPYEVALDAALEELTHAQAAAQMARNVLMSRETRVAELTQLVRNLLAVLPPDRAALYARRLDRVRVPPSAVGRSGPVYDNVVNLFGSTPRRNWSAAEVQEALTEAGKQADPKAVYNVLNYLARRGRLRRIGRGRYLITDLGVGIELDQDLPGVDVTGGGCMED